MKTLHRDDLFGWSRFDEARNLDFHSVLWRRPGGNVAIDPLPLSAHDQAHLDALGGVSLIVLTNSEHARDAAALAARTGATIAGPRGEQGTFSLPTRWLADGEELVPGLVAVELHGSKTPGELALVLEQRTLITGDLVRAFRGGQLDLLPDGKLKDPKAARASVRRLYADFPLVDAVLVGDGWPVFRGGRELLAELMLRVGAS